LGWQDSSNVPLKEKHINGEDIIYKNLSASQQSFTARDIKDSIIIQYSEEPNYARPLVDQKINEGFRQAG